MNNLKHYKIIKNVLYTGRKGWMPSISLYSTQVNDFPANKLERQLIAKIKTTGPITVAEYMKEVLINPSAGYYMQQDAIGSKGDFITSPEISQMFGELIGIWCAYEWMKLNCPNPFHVVELGPGTGALLGDMYRAFQKFPHLEKSLSLHLVEISPKMQALQEKHLCDKNLNALSSQNSHTNGNHFYKQNQTKDGVPIYWYTSLHDVPSAFSCYIAHEFFDALPIHKFKNTVNGWREILIDIDSTQDPKLTYVLSPLPTPASKTLINPDEKREEVEICAEAGVVMETLCKRLTEDGGFSLIADYGHCGTKTDTFRAFRKHQLWSPLNEPGMADLTADVDFSYLKDITKDKVVSYGPIPQGHFLKNMSIEVRLQQLMANSSSERKNKLQKEYDILINPEEMGERFKFFALYPSVLKTFLERYPPAGFS